ncbi:LacI family DNA-binding transcriptional regulator [Faecalicatena orotica]|uniref:LacI family DNA-binding transcriptional regulator n=1 Tax=Faecalicatena orotica TaxID=1544 RepID=UPI003216CF96
MVTIKKIAEIAGVSRGTVDRVLNNRPGVNAETYHKVKEIADKLGYEPNMAGQMLAARKKKIRLGFIVCDTPVDLFFADVYRAACKKAEELKTYGVTVHFYLIKELSDKFIAPLLREAEEDDLDGIALVPLKMSSIQTFVNKMNARKVPMVFFNLDMEDVQRLSYVGCDYYDSGKVAAGLISLVTREKGRIALATSFDEQSPAFRQRLEGFIKELDEEYPQIEIVNRDSNFVFQKGDYSNILDVVKREGHLEALYIINPGDYSICEEVEKLDKERRIKIITNDVNNKQKSFMDRGIISATIGQQPEKQGALPLQILYDFIGLGIEPANQYLTELSIHIKQNIAGKV